MTRLWASQLAWEARSKGQGWRIICTGQKTTLLKDKTRLTINMRLTTPLKAMDCRRSHQYTPWLWLKPTLANLSSLPSTKELGMLFQIQILQRVVRIPEKRRAVILKSAQSTTLKVLWMETGQPRVSWKNSKLEKASSRAWKIKAYQVNSKILIKNIARWNRINSNPRMSLRTPIVILRSNVMIQITTTQLRNSTLIPMTSPSQKLTPWMYIFSIKINQLKTVSQRAKLTQLSLGSNSSSMQIL